MLRRLMKFISPGQSGFTLIEMTIVMGILVVLGTGIVAITTQIFKVSDTTHYRLIATKQVERAVDVISRDAAVVQFPYPLAPMDASGFSSTPGTANLSTPALYLGYTTWQNANYIVAYWISNQGPSNRQLIRREFRNGVQQSQTVVANYVVWNSGSSSSPTRYVYSANVLTFTVTCTLGQANPVTESRTFQIVPRQ
jgi:prepilin-type N-terminal cleavage/methylation domain-containing protein